MEWQKRKKTRLEGYDYASCGAYFITVCVAAQTPSLWADGAEPPLSPYGRMVQRAIEQISSHYEHVAVDRYCIMPDHIHLIVFLLPDAQGRMSATPTISAVVGSMKRWVSRQAGLSIWQKSFYDRVLRSEEEYRRVWNYIDENPIKYALRKE